MIASVKELVEWLVAAAAGKEQGDEFVVCCHDDQGNVYTFETPFKYSKMIDTSGKNETLNILSIPIKLRAAKAMPVDQVN